MKSTFPEIASLVSEFVESHGSIWRDIDPTYFEIGTEFDDKQKFMGAELSTTLLADLEEHLMHFPRSAAQQSNWRGSAFGMLRRFTDSCLQYSFAAFGVADGTDMTLLLATNDLTGADADGDASDNYSHVYDTNGDGVLDDSELALREQANAVFTAINEGGDI